MLSLANKLQTLMNNQVTQSLHALIESPNSSRLRSIAQKILTNATAVSSSATTAYDGSLRGFSALSIGAESLSKDDRSNIENWVRQLVGPEKEPENITIDQPKSSSSAATEPENNGRTSGLTEVSEPDFNPEEDFNADLMLNLIKAGKRHYESSNWEQAGENLDLSFQYAKKLSPGRRETFDLTEVRLMLASIYLQKCELDRSEEHLLTLLEESVVNEANRLLIYDSYLILSQVYLLKKRYADAQMYCLKCMHGRGRDLGKDSQPYFKTVQLLAQIYQGKGSHLEADIMLQKLPEDLREDTVLLLQNSSPERKLTLSPPLSPQSTGHERSKSHSLFRKRPSADRPRSPNPQALASGLGIGYSSPTMAPRKASDASKNPTLHPEIDPQTLLSQGGFSGDFDASKALEWAIVESHLKLVHYLVEGYTTRSRKSRLGLSSDDNTEIKRAKVNGSGRAKRIPLMVAIENGRVMITKLLLDKGASTSIKDDLSRSPLRAAAEGGHAEIVKLLLAKGAWIESFDPQSTESRAYAPIHGAAANGHEEIVDLLLQHSAAINSKDTHGSTPLKVAAQRGQEAVCRLLISKGATVNTPDDAGWTALMIAAFNGHDAVARLLVRASASIDVANHLGQSALEVAAEQGRENVARILLNNGASLEHRDNAGWTALIAAANKAHLNMVVLLLGAGANINAQSGLGSTALDRAEYRQDRRVIRCLKDNGAWRGTGKMERKILTPFTGYAL